MGPTRKGLNRHISDAGFAELRRQLTYKTPEGHLLVAPRFYASSKICSNCEIENQDLQLSTGSGHAARAVSGTTVT